MADGKKMPGDYPPPPPPTFAQWVSGMAAIGVPAHLLPAEQQHQQQQQQNQQYVLVPSLPFFALTLLTIER